jgi:hypothetical protein
MYVCLDRAGLLANPERAGIDLQSMRNAHRLGLHMKRRVGSLAVQCGETSGGE